MKKSENLKNRKFCRKSVKSKNVARANAQDCVRSKITRAVKIADLWNFSNSSSVIKMNNQTIKELRAIGTDFDEAIARAAEEGLIEMKSLVGLVHERRRTRLGEKNMALKKDAGWGWVYNKCSSLVKSKLPAENLTPHTR